MIKLYIDTFQVDEKDIIELPFIEELISLDEGDLFSSIFSIQLNNSNRFFDIRNSASIFYKNMWRNKIVELYDDDRLIIKGKIKSYHLDDGQNIITLEAHNKIKDLAETPLVFFSSEGKVWAQIILEILENSGIPDDDIFINTFQSAINYQNYNSANGRINYSRADNQNVLPVLTEICRISNCILYTSQNKIGIFQWRKDIPTSGVIDASKIIKGSLRLYGSQKIYNSVVVNYVFGTQGARITVNDLDSIARNGLIGFNAPDKNVERHSMTRVNLIYSSQKGAEWASNSILDRYYSGVENVEWTSPDIIELDLGSVYTLNIHDYEENVIILSKNRIKETNEIEYLAEKI